MFDLAKRGLEGGGNNSLRGRKVANTAIKVLHVLWWLLIPNLVVAQCPGPASGCPQPVPVPHLLKVSGALRDHAGKPRSGTVGIMFSLYSDSGGGAPLWQETQNVQLDSQGHYTVLLGAATSDGVPVDLFKSGDSRWLASQVLLPGEEEQPRVLLVSVPYALRAADAETLGGLPASAFVKVAPGISSQVQPSPGSTTPNSAPQTTVAVTGSAAAGSWMRRTVSSLLPNSYRLIDLTEV